METAHSDTLDLNEPAYAVSVEKYSDYTIAGILSFSPSFAWHLSTQAYALVCHSADRLRTVIGADAIRWLRGCYDVLDVKGILGLIGVHFFFGRTADGGNV